MKKYGHDFSCGTWRKRGRAGIKSMVFFHSACGGKGSTGIALGIGMDIPAWPAGL